MTNYQLTKAQAKKYAEGYNMAVANHANRVNDQGKSPRGWAGLGYDNVRGQIVARQLVKSATSADILAPFESITSETAQTAWDAAEVRIQAAMAKFKANC